MSREHLTVTVVTRMNEGRRCVAAWSHNRGQIVRPLPNGDYFSGPFLDKYGIVPGTKLWVDPIAIRARSFPHHNNDMGISKAGIEYENQGGNDWHTRLDMRPNETLEDCFEDRLETSSQYHGYRKVFVSGGTQCPSLGGVMTSTNNIVYFEESFGGGPRKLRAKISIGLNRYNLPVTSHQLLTQYENVGVAVLNDEKSNFRQAHMRLGFAMPYGENRCALQLNGVLLS